MTGPPARQSSQLLSRRPSRTRNISDPRGGPTAGGSPSVVVVDDEPDLILLVERILTRHGFSVVGTAADGRAGIELVAEVQPDVVLLDLAMPEVDGASALPSIVTKAPRTMVVVFSAHLDSERAEDLLAKGAFAAYEKGNLRLLPDALSDDLISFRRVLAGEDDVPSWQRRYQRL